MNVEHLRAFLWLRWRLFVNQLQRGGVANVVVLAIMAVLCIAIIVILGVASFLVGLFAIPDEHPEVVMYVWDGLVVVFLMMWAGGLVTELQRSEALSLEKFLHLPVSLAGAFVLNYLSSLLSLTLIVFLPAMFGFALGLAISKGPGMLIVLPLLGAFLLMVTAVTYQFQGWLASLMVNKRRRRAVVVGTMFVFVILCQLPNLVNFIRPWERANKDELMSEEETRQLVEQVKDTFKLVNLVPPGWLPLGAFHAVEGNLLPALLGTLGMGLIGTGSLWRAYRTTIRLYTGQFTSGRPANTKVEPVPVIGGQTSVASSSIRRGNMLERELPWLSEQAAVIALGSLRSLLRAPEVKMLLLSPIIMLVIFGAMMFRGPINLPIPVRPLMTFGAACMSLFFMIGLAGNMFGFDRSGFRIFVLSPASRSDILLGKNLAVAPLALALVAVPVILLQILFPMRFDHFLAVFPLFVTMYLIFCILANWLSILAPMPIAAGTLKPTNMKLVPILLQMLFIFLFPWIMAPTLLPLGIEYMLSVFELDGGLPICLILTLVECAVVIFFYRLLLTWQGNLLQSREQGILQTVTTKME